MLLSNISLVVLLDFKSQEGHPSSAKNDGLKRDFQSMDSSDYQMDEVESGTDLI